MNKPIRVLIAKPGLDGHDRGALVVAQGLRDEGMEVIYSGLRQTPAQIVSTAIQEDVDCIGLSILSGAHNELFPEVIHLLKENQAEDITVIGGGVIPEEDIPFLLEQGIKRVFTPGTSIKEIAQSIRDHLGFKPQRNLRMNKIDHIGIAVDNLDSSIQLFRDIFGLKMIGTEEVPSERVKVAFFEVGNLRLELLEATHQDSPIHKFIEKKGEGIHHLAFEVDQINEQFAILNQLAIPLLQEEPKMGAHDRKVGFIHPKATAKVLIELCEKE